HPDRSLMIVFVERNGLNHESTRTGPGGKLCGDLQRRGAEQGGIHFVALEWPSQVQLLTVLTLRRCPGRKVPLQFGRSRNELGDADGGLADRGPLIAHEEENLVLLDGSPKGAAELVALQSVPGGGEEIPRIQA